MPLASDNSSDMSNLREGIGCAFTATAQLVMMFLGLAIYIWTIVVAFKMKGLGAAILSTLLPKISQIYWLIKIWNARMYSPKSLLPSHPGI